MCKKKIKEKSWKLNCYLAQVDQQSAAVALTWSLSVFTVILVLFGLVVVWFTNPHSCLDKSDVKDKKGRWDEYTIH